MTCIIKLPTCGIKRMQAWVFLLVKHVFWTCLSWACLNIYWILFIGLFVCLHTLLQEKGQWGTQAWLCSCFFAFKCSGWKVRFIVLSRTPNRTHKRRRQTTAVLTTERLHQNNTKVVQNSCHTCSKTPTKNDSGRSESNTSHVPSKKSIVLPDRATD